MFQISRSLFRVALDGMNWWLERRACSAGQVYVCILLLLHFEGTMLNKIPDTSQADDVFPQDTHVQDGGCALTI